MTQMLFRKTDLGQPGGPCARGVGRAWHGNQGSVATVLALLLLTLLGFVALGTDVTYAIVKQRQMQAVATAAALSGATALMMGAPADFTIEAKAVAASVGFVNGTGGTNVAVNHPPSSGNYTANSTAVEVVISQPLSLPLAGLFGPRSWTVRGRAVAQQGNTGSYCFAALDPAAASAFYLGNNASVTSTTCGVLVNSSSPTALMLDQNTTINGPVQVVGGWSLAGHARIVGPANEGSSPAVDPYAGLTLGTVPACTGQSGTASNKGKVSLTPAHFCSGWNFGNNVQISLAPGTYFIDSQFSVGNNATITGSGVTLVVNGNYAASIGNNAALTLTAPTTGDFAGIAIMGLSTDTTKVQSFANNERLNVTGTIYFPHQTVEFDNNGMTGGGGCTHIIANKLRVMNNAELDNNCSGTGVKMIGVGQSKLVE